MLLAVPASPGITEMKTLRAWFLVLAASAVPAWSAEQPALPGYVIPRSEVRTLPVNADGRHYALFVGLPASYATEPNKRYPVVYVTDGYWDFHKLTAIHGPLVYDRYAPEFIVVGMGYAGENLNYGDLRRWELSPVPFGMPLDASGRARDFLDTIEKVFIPLIDKEYRTDPRMRVLGGASLGGLFTLYSMFTKPDLFNGYVAVTPAVLVGDGWLLKYEEEFMKSGKSLNARLYMTVGGNEATGFMAPILRMNQRFAPGRYPKLAYEFRIIDGERHAGNQLESYNRGLRFVFAPMAPEQGPAIDPAPPPARRP
jgi:predicted alpha/beta superfamily hydrolase